VDPLVSDDDDDDDDGITREIRCDGGSGEKVKRSPRFSVSSGLASFVRVHHSRGRVFLGHRAGVVVHLRFRFGVGAGDLSTGVPVAGDAGVGAGFSGAAHDGGEVVVGERLSVLGGDGLVGRTI
jgi:hypothetical protein